MKILHINNAKKKGEMLLDDEDYELLKDVNIQINDVSSKHTKYGVIVNKNYLGKINNKYESIYISREPVHRLIMGLGDFKYDKRIINHIDGNGLNNQKKNLEISTPIHNSQSVNRTNNKKFGCVTYDNSMKRKKRWRAVYSSYGKKTQKRFENKLDGYKFLLIKEIEERVLNNRIKKL